MPKCLELINQSFGRLLVLAKAPAREASRWYAKCTCGSIKIYLGGSLKWVNYNMEVALRKWKIS